MNKLMLCIKQNRALDKFWLVESCFWILGPVKADTSHSGRPMNNDIPMCDVSALTGPSIQKVTFNQSELV